MMTPDEWKRLVDATLRPKPVSAPPYLWTRIQAGIEAKKAALAPWWFQWRWMTGFTLTTGALAAAIVFFRLTPHDLPLEAMLEGQPHPHAAIQVASTQWTNPDHTAGFILEEQPWVDD